MASKLPCVTFGAGGIKEIIINNKNGYIAPIKKCRALAGVINKIISADNHILKSNAHKTVKNKFKEENMFMCYERLYKKILTK